MPEIGTRRTRWDGAQDGVIEVYRPDAQPWRAGWVAWGPLSLGRPVGDGWVRVYAPPALNFPIRLGDRIYAAH